MTRKDYIKLAAALHAERADRQTAATTADKHFYHSLTGAAETHGERDGFYFAQGALRAIDTAVDAIADVLQADNARFDRVRFLDAVKGGK